MNRLALSAFAQRPFAALARWTAERQTRRELARLDVRMLQDIGLDRADIDAAARGALRPVMANETRIIAGHATVMFGANEPAAAANDAPLGTAALRAA